MAKRDLDEVVFSNDGQIVVVFGVASELGFGEREVAVNLKSLRLSKDENNNLVLTLNATKDALKNAPERTLPGERSAGGTDHTTGLRRLLLAITEYLTAELRNGEVQEAPALLPVESRCAARRGCAGGSGSWVRHYTRLTCSTHSTVEADRCC
jgi:hypothetical protein